MHDLYAVMLSGGGRNTNSRARLLICEVVERRVAGGERLGISPEVRVGRVLIEAGPSVAALVAGLAQFGMTPTDVAVGFEGDLSAEHAQHRQIKFGPAAARFGRASDAPATNAAGTGAFAPTISRPGGVCPLERRARGNANGSRPF